LSEGKCPRCGSKKTYRLNRLGATKPDMIECGKCGFVYTHEPGEIYDPRAVRVDQ
jgi:uncharacterized Zn finger protein